MFYGYDFENACEIVFARTLSLFLSTVTDVVFPLIRWSDLNHKETDCLFTFRPNFAMDKKQKAKLHTVLLKSNHHHFWFIARRILKAHVPQNVCKTNTDL